MSGVDLKEHMADAALRVLALRGDPPRHLERDREPFIDGDNRR
eukprot:gene15784-50437_t